MSAVPIIPIVDDDASVRRSLLRAVESAGYKASPGFPTAARIESSKAVGHRRKPFDRTTVLDTIRRAVGALQARRSTGLHVGDGHSPREPQP